MNNKGLRLHTLFGTCLAMILPCVVLADAPSNIALGEVDAILKFCAKSDSRLEGNAHKLESLLTSQASPGARGTAEYKQGYDLVTDALEKGNKAQVLAACSQDLAPKTSRDDHARH